MAQEKKANPTKKKKRPATEVFEVVEEVDEEVKAKKVKSKSKKKAKKKGKRQYEKLPERELRRQLKRIERRATRRVVMITLGLFSIAFAILANYTLGIIALFAAFFGLYGVIYSLFALIRIKEVKWYFIIAGLAVNIAGLALSIGPTIAAVQHIIDNIGSIASLF
ncbi:MAG TPA: hypothetical protein VFD05_01120 [Bacilli bacterium]|nr:hypothetical protein [Bacilli bacterium]